MPTFTERTEHRITAKLPSGILEIAVDTVTLRDGDELTRTTHRHVLEPGDALNDEPAEVATIADLVWTEERRAAFDALRADRQAKLDAIDGDAQ